MNDNDSEIKIRQVKKCKINLLYGIIKITIFLIFLLVCVQVVHNVTKRKYPYQKSEGFFTQEEDFDVLFFGSSHMYTVAYPMQLWRDYGIISYNLGQTSSTLAETYYNMLLALKEKKPKLIVLDSYFVNLDSKLPINGNIPNSMHNTFDPY